jgi:hypothetical protein
MKVLLISPLVCAERGQLANEYNSQAIQLEQLHTHVTIMRSRLPRDILTLVFGYLWMGPVIIAELIGAIHDRALELIETGRVINGEVMRLFQV